MTSSMSLNVADKHKRNAEKQALPFETYFHGIPVCHVHGFIQSYMQTDSPAVRKRDGNLELYVTAFVFLFFLPRTESSLPVQTTVGTYIHILFAIADKHTRSWAGSDSYFRVSLMAFQITAPCFSFYVTFA